MAQASSRSWFEAMLVRARRQVRLALASPARLFDDDDRRQVADEIHDGGRLTNAYGFMLFSACGIAALGLLQSSVAVIIGAMLISPLMGPILAMGLAMAQLEPRAFKRAAVTLAIGAALSVLASVCIVLISPLKNVTPEILARTQPTLLDLIVALLSGFVGAYLTINRKGGAIAGVAIATALMPPLAVVGFGIATLSPAIAGGALLLFMTNVVAILGAVFAVARRYGYRPVARTGAAWETPALIGAMVLLCVPLALSLRSIVTETRETVRARTAIEQAFAGQSPHISGLVVQTGRGGVSAVECVVVTRRYVPGAADLVRRQLDPDAQVTIEQVVTAAPSAAAPAVAAARPAAGTQPTPLSAEQRLRAMLAPSGQVVAVETRDDALAVNYVLPAPAGLADYRAVEAAAQRFTPETAVRILPPPQALPPVTFGSGGAAIGDEQRATLDLIAWALQRWGVETVSVEGLAAPGLRGPRPADRAMAQKRGEAVAEVLRDRGVTVAEVVGTVPERRPDDEGAWQAARVTPTAAQ